MVRHLFWELWICSILVEIGCTYVIEVVANVWCITSYSGCGETWKIKEYSKLTKKLFVVTFYLGQLWKRLRQLQAQ